MAATVLMHTKMEATASSNDTRITLQRHGMTPPWECSSGDISRDTTHRATHACFPRCAGERRAGKFRASLRLRPLTSRRGRRFQGRENASGRIRMQAPVHCRRHYADWLVVEVRAPDRHTDLVLGRSIMCCHVPLSLLLSLCRSFVKRLLFPSSNHLPSHVCTCTWVGRVKNTLPHGRSPKGREDVSARVALRSSCIQGTMLHSRVHSPL